MSTYSTSPGSTPARSSPARITIEPSSVAWCPARPPPSLPNGVRTAETITERVIGLSVPKPCLDASAGAPYAGASMTLSHRIDGWAWRLGRSGSVR